MRAILIRDGKGPAQNLYLGETSDPSPSEGEVIVKASIISLLSAGIH